jgi:hypothetical protein
MSKKRSSEKERQRAYGAGRKAELEHLDDKLLFTWFILAVT